MSSLPAALKLNGAYLGLINSFEKFVDISDGDLNAPSKIFAEILPDGDALPLGFFIGAKLFDSPPPYLDVYLSDGDAVIYAHRFERRAHPLKVIAQTEFGGGLYTLFTNGGKVYLNGESPANNLLLELSDAYAEGRLSVERVGGFPVLTVAGAGELTVISESGKRVFYNPAESFTCGDKLFVTVNFNTCAGCKAECAFGYDGEKMTLESSRTREYMPPNGDIMHFAFFESVLTRGDYSAYLCEELKEHAEDLPDFLGKFTDVTLPYGKFYERHGNIRAAGLVYPIKDNLFDVKYFAVDVQDGKIVNVYSV